MVVVVEFGLADFADEGAVGAGGVDADLREG
jgi:hypothetical protein